MRFLKNLLRKLYWKYVGEVTIVGVFNGVVIVVSKQATAPPRLYIGPKGKIEHFVVEDRAVDSEEFQTIIDVYERQ